MEILAIFPKEVVCPLFIRTLSPFLKYNNKTCFIFIFFNKLIYCTIRVVESDPSYPVRFALKRNVYILQKKKIYSPSITFNETSSPKSLRITFNQVVFGIKSLSRRQVGKDSLLDVGKNSTASSINLSSGFYQEEDCCCTF